jgi:hypothetical protein
MKIARRKAGSEREVIDNIIKAICEMVMPWKMRKVRRARVLRQLETCDRARRSAVLRAIRLT